MKYLHFSLWIALTIPVSLIEPTGKIILIVVGAASYFLYHHARSWKIDVVYGLLALMIIEFSLVLVHDDMSPAINREVLGSAVLAMIAGFLLEFIDRKRTTDPTATPASLPPIQRALVRRQSDESRWGLTDKHGCRYIDNFPEGIMFDVKFCGPLHPFKSGCPATKDPGEMIGALRTNITASFAGMPALCTIVVVYNPEKQAYCQNDEPDTVITQADFVALRKDGSILAGWRNLESAGFPKLES